MQRLLQASREADLDWDPLDEEAMESGDDFRPAKKPLSMKKARVSGMSQLVVWPGHSAQQAIEAPSRLKIVRHTFTQT